MILFSEKKEEQIFLGRELSQHRDYGEDTAKKIDEEVRRIVEAAHLKASEILQSREPLLHLMADALIKYETIDGKQIDQIMEGQQPDPPADWNDSSPEPAEGKEDVSDADKRPTIGGPAEQI